MLGYCIECALKACAAKQFRLHEVPDQKFVNAFYKHDLNDLLKTSGVKSELEKHARSDSNFEINWNTVRDWSVTSRYEPGITEALAAECTKL